MSRHLWKSHLRGTISTGLFTLLFLAIALGLFFGVALGFFFGVALWLFFGVALGLFLTVAARSLTGMLFHELFDHRTVIFLLLSALHLRTASRLSISEAGALLRLRLRLGFASVHLAGWLWLRSVPRLDSLWLRLVPADWLWLGSVPAHHGWHTPMVMVLWLGLVLV